MLKNRKIFRYLLIFVGIIPFFIVTILFVPSVQKSLFENQLTPWISNASVDSIHITPFSIKIDNLKLSYEAIDIHINHLDSDLSPFSLFQQRIKIDKLILNQIVINDATPPSEKKEDSILLFQGLFPYFETGFIYDIGQLDINANYLSSATGPVTITLSGQDINENTDQPIKLQVVANELSVIPDIQGLTLNSSIILRQHSTTAVNAQQSHFNLELTNEDGSQQFISAQLSMKQLPKPDKWATFPFDKRQTHYLRKRLHPESIELQITHTNQDKKELAALHYNGQYDGNEGILSGAFKLITDKAFTHSLQSLALPKIESKITATFHYNTRSLEGDINLADEIKVEDYLFDSALSKQSSLPKQVDISNRLVASIDDKHLIIDSFLLNILSGGQEYIKIMFHKALSFNLNDLPEFLEQENNDLIQININQLPLKWFDDFIADYQIKEGVLDTDINLAIENNNLKLISNRPIHLKDISLLENIKSKDANQVTVQNNNKANPLDKTKSLVTNYLLTKQNLEADFTINMSSKNLDASIKQLKLYQKNQPKKIIEQISSSLTFNMKNPLDFIKQTSPELPPITIETDGTIDIRALTQIPVISRNFKQLAETIESSQSPDNKSKTSGKTLIDTIPKVLSLKYQLGIHGKNSLWTLIPSNIKLLSGKHIKKTNPLLNVNNSQAIQFHKNKQQLKLLTKGQLFSTQVNHFDFSWVSPIIKKYAAPYTLSGQLAKFDLDISSVEQQQPSTSTTEEDKNTKQPDIDQESFLLSINKMKFTQLESHENQKAVFKDINIDTKINARYSPKKIIINYPLLSIKKSNALLIHNSGKIIINNPADQKTQQLIVTGKLNGYLHQIMNLNIINQLTKDNTKLTQESLLDSHYNLSILNNKIIIDHSKLKISHPKNNGRLILTTKKPISLSLKDKQHNFSQNGHLSFELIDFNIKPYESMFPDLPISFDHANGHFDLMQTTKKQEIILKKPFQFQNVHFKNKEKELLSPFNVMLDFSAHQKKNITQGRIKKLAIEFIDKKTKEKNKDENAFVLDAQFKLNLDKKIILSELDANLDLIIPQWLKQPVAIPNNTLTQGTLNTQFTIDKKHNITHKWLINNLVTNNGQQLVESIAIDGTGQLKSLSDLELVLPIIMKSVSGDSNVILKTKTSLQDENKQITMNIDGQTLYLNDLLKLLAAINPESELSQLEDEESKEQVKAENTVKETLALDKSAALEPFWKSGMDISSQLKIDTLYYTDYMSYKDIAGQLDITDDKLHARDFKMKFHESPMNLNALLNFNAADERPYDINFKTTLSRFGVGKFLTELNPEHVPRADGIFDVDVNIYGGLSNLSQFRNELLFDILIEGKDGVFHLIPSNDMMMRSSGAAMAVVGEVVSVLPTSGFGLGIVNRVIRFAKDIDYDFIKMHLVRNNDLHTNIKTFQIISPELHLLATGGLTFVEDTRLFDQPLEMTAEINLAGEGAAIFYGLALLKKEKDDYGFWKGPVINFSGTLNHQEDNFNEIISKAKSGTLAGGFTNPFSGLIGDFRYRWFGDTPDYSHLNKPSTQKTRTKEITPALPETTKTKASDPRSVKQENKNTSFFDDTF